MRPRIVFGIQSAVHQASTLAQLAGALDGHRIVVHHDFSQQPDFSVTAPNVAFVDDFVRTGWADWGLTMGIERTLDYALRHYEFDYFQLLSPVDLPIRPIAEFEDWVRQDDADFHNDTISLDEDELTFMTFAYRAFASEGSAAYRLLWQAREAFFGHHYETENRACLSVPLDCRRGENGRPTWTASMMRVLTHSYVALRRRLPRFLANDVSAPVHMGGMWFGASRKGCEFLVDALRDPVVAARFKPYFCSGEMLFSTVFQRSGLRVGPTNHVVSPFVGARPEWLQLTDLDWLTSTGKFFARKFPDDPEAPVRTRILERIGAVAINQ